MTVVPKSRKTNDPKYKEAKQALKSYIFNMDKLIDSIRKLGDRAFQISKLYSKICSDVISWFPNTSPLLRQTMTSIDKSSQDLKQIVSDDFIKIIIPSFEQILEEYTNKINFLLTLEKKRRDAVKIFDIYSEKLRQEQASNMTDEDTVVRLEKQVAITGNEYNKLNDQYILAVNNFTEERKKEFYRSFAKCFSKLMKFINDTTNLSFIKYPEIQYPPILPPAPPNSGSQPGMPVYVSNNNIYKEVMPNSAIQGNNSSGISYVQYYKYKTPSDQSNETSNSFYSVSGHISTSSSTFSYQHSSNANSPGSSQQQFQNQPFKNDSNSLLVSGENVLMKHDNSCQYVDRTRSLIPPSIPNSNSQSQMTSGDPKTYPEVPVQQQASKFESSDQCNSNEPNVSENPAPFSPKTQENKMKRSSAFTYANPQNFYMSSLCSSQQYSRQMNNQTCENQHLAANVNYPQSNQCFNQQQPFSSSTDSYSDYYSDSDSDSDSQLDLQLQLQDLQNPYKKNKRSSDLSSRFQSNQKYKAPLPQPKKHYSSANPENQKQANLFSGSGSVSTFSNEKISQNFDSSQLFSNQNDSANQTSDYNASMSCIKTIYFKDISSSNFNKSQNKSFDMNQGMQPQNKSFDMNQGMQPQNKSFDMNQGMQPQNKSFDMNQGMQPQNASNYNCEQPNYYTHQSSNSQSNEKQKNNVFNSNHSEAKMRKAIFSNSSFSFAVGQSHNKVYSSPNDNNNAQNQKTCVNKNKYN
ncbi:hypothetical protein M9Y10_039417 [Tritrichomonas musculus]|uniref:BAR domain-containing protein n=1 Tax=Tritrichomonas musculus TaxID=1915356 RepID=A0ABR2KB96_9EUKA